MKSCGCAAACTHKCRNDRAALRRAALLGASVARYRTASAREPGQKALEFTPPTSPLPGLNPTAPKERKEGLQRKAMAILRRLEQGSVDNLELPRIGGARYGARLGEVRDYLRWLYGRGKGWEPIEVVENKKTGWALYTLEIAPGRGGREVAIGEPPPGADVLDSDMEAL